MTKAKHADTDEIRKTLRPALIASRRTVLEYTTYLHRLLVGLADESIATALVCPPNCDFGRIAPIPADVFLHPPIDLPLMESVGIEQLAGYLEKFRPSVLHCLCESRAALTRRLAQRLDVPYVLAINSLAKKHSQLPISSAHCASIMVPAQTILDHVVKVHPRYADRVRLVNMGTFAEPEPVCFADPSRLSSIVVVHPFDRVADFEKLFQAIRDLIGDGHEFMVVVMGRGRAERPLRRLLAEYGLSEIVTLVPPLDPWRSVLAAGDILVQPQPNEAFSAVLLEAMGLGTVVLACAGGVDDLIVANQTSLVFEPKSETSLRDHLGRLLSDHRFARRLAGMAQSYIGGRYSVGAMVAATLETYAQAQQQYAQAAH